MSYARSSTRPFATSKPPMPVRICGFSHTCHRLDCAGHLSLEHGVWYCSVTCYQLQRLFNGEPMTLDQMRVLCDVRDNHYPNEVIEANKERTEYLLATRQVKQVIDREIRRDLNGDNDSNYGDY